MTTTANHPAHPVIWDKTVECTGLTKRDWLMAHLPLELIHTLPKDGVVDNEAFCAEHARLARIWADAIIKEAARDE